MTTRTHFTFRVDTWTPDGESIVEHVAGVEDYQVALATFRAACERSPGTPITLRQGARVWSALFVGGGGQYSSGNTRFAGGFFSRVRVSGRADAA